MIGCVVSGSARPELDDAPRFSGHDAKLQFMDKRTIATLHEILFHVRLNPIGKSARAITCHWLKKPALQRDSPITSGALAACSEAVVSIIFFSNSFSN